MRRGHPVDPELIARHGVVEPFVVRRYHVGVVVPAPKGVMRPANHLDRDKPRNSLQSDPTQHLPFIFPAEPKHNDFPQF